MGTDVPGQIGSQERNSDIVWTRVDQRKVRYRLTPETDNTDGKPLGLPLLLLHGLGCSSDAWEPTLHRFKNERVDCPILAPDMPGYGRSRGPQEALGIVEMADWAVRFLDVFSLSRVHIAGNSMGCQVALALARRHPDRVGGLILVGPTTGDHYVSPWRYGLGLLRDSFEEPLRYNWILARMYREMGVPRYLATVAKMLDDDPVAHAAEVEAPTLVVRGEHDKIIPDAAARKLAAHLPNGAFTLVRDSAHTVQFHRPDRFTEIAREFLSTHRGV